MARVLPSSWRWPALWVSHSLPSRPWARSLGLHGLVFLVSCRLVSIPELLHQRMYLTITVITLTVSVSIQDRPAAAPQVGPWQSDFELFKSPTFAEAAAALSSIVFAFCGIPAYFNVVSEMKDHKDYFKALSLCQFVMTSIYIAIGVVVYYYCGSYVASPALGSAGVLMKKVCYGLALPGLLASVVLVTHVSYTPFSLCCL